MVVRFPVEVRRPHADTEVLRSHLEGGAVEPEEICQIPTHMAAQEVGSGP